MLKIISREKLCEFIEYLKINSYAIVCVGTYLRSDDRVALELCNRLSMLENIEIIQCEYGLENCAHEIIEKNLKKIAIFDAVIVKNHEYNNLHEFNNLIVLSVDELKNMSKTIFTSHSMPMDLAIKYIINAISYAEIVIVGIPVKNLEIGLKLSPEVENFVKNIVECFVDNYQIKHFDENE